MKCLLVEHDSKVADLVCQVVQAGGFEVTRRLDAGSAEQALARESFELLVLDLDLPGLIGPDFCRRMRRPGNPRTHILAITARDSDDDLQAVLEAGADDCLARPIEAKRLQIRLAVATRQIQVVAERQRVEDSLRKSEALYRLLAENATDIISQHSPTGTYQYVSPAIRALLGYEPDELLGGAPYDFILPEDQPGLQNVPFAMIDNQKVYTVAYRTRHKDGRYLWFETTCKELTDPKTGEKREIVCVSRDISERKRQEHDLLESEAKWRGLVENAPDIIMLIDREGIIRFINRTIPSLTVAGVTGTSCFNYTLPQAVDRMREAMSRAFDRGEPDEFEVEGLTGPNQHGWFSCHIGPLRVDGAISGAVVVVTEITKSKRSEEALLKERSLLKRLIDLQERERQLVAYEIHDGLAQYLTGSLMHLEACGTPPTDNAELHRHDFERGVSLLRTAVSEARRLISGLRPPILDEAGIVPAVEYLVNESRYVLPELTYKHETTFDRLTPQLECAVFRIVQEALTNVRRHSQSARASVELVEKDGILRIEVRDWGVGFDPHQVREERFGLQGIRERARLLGGFATIDSAPGQGTRVHVEFPITGEEP